MKKGYEKKTPQEREERLSVPPEECTYLLREVLHLDVSEDAWRCLSKGACCRLFKESYSTQNCIACKVAGHRQFYCARNTKSAAALSAEYQGNEPRNMVFCVIRWCATAFIARAPKPVVVGSLATEAQCRAEEACAWQLMMFSAR